MYNQRKEDKCHRIAAFGGETGAGSVEGRGLFAGVTVAGVHAEVSERGGRSLSFRGSVYYGSTDEGNDLAADGKHREVSRMLWIPELGSYGRFKLGRSYDETKAGLQKVQKELLLGIVKEAENADLYKKMTKDYDRLKGHLSPKTYKELVNFLTGQGLKSVWRPNLSSYEKDTFSSGYIWEYGNIEFKYMLNKEGNIIGDVYSSYNAANSWIDHGLLDGIGYIMSN